MNPNAIILRSEEHADALKIDLSPISDWTSCPRCKGKGYLDVDLYGGICYRCEGTAKVPATKAGRSMFTDIKREHKLARLRILWVGCRDAMKVATEKQANAIRQKMSMIEAEAKVIKS